MLQPHFRLPVVTGLRCLLVCAFWLPAQLVNRNNMIIDVNNNDWRIPVFDAIFFNIFMSLILRFFRVISLEFSTNNPSACSENNPTEDASPKIYANLALIIV
jgi:hypothetical protein